MKLSRILCPIDFSDAGKHAVEHAAVIAEFYHARIDALHVVTPLTLTASGVTNAGEELRDPARQEELEDAIAPCLRERRVRVAIKLP